MKKSIYTVEVVEGKRRTSTNIEISDAGMAMGVFKKTLIPWSEIASIDIEGPENLNTRVTATRLLTLGVFALAAKKKSGETLVMFSFKSGEPKALMFKNLNSGEIRTIFAPIMHLLSPEEKNEDSPVSSAQQIKEMGQLVADGLLTQEEFEAAKKKILGI
jgi:hypothetical protein